MLRRCSWLAIWLHFLFSVVCGGGGCVCHARFAGWFYEGAASWVVGASSDRHSMAAVGGQIRGWYRHCAYRFMASFVRLGWCCAWEGPVWVCCYMLAVWFLGWALASGGGECGSEQGSNTVWIKRPYLSVICACGRWPSITVISNRMPGYGALLSVVVLQVLRG